MFLRRKENLLLCIEEFQIADLNEFLYDELTTAHKILGSEIRKYLSENNPELYAMIDIDYSDKDMIIMFAESIKDIQ